MTTSIASTDIAYRQMTEDDLPAAYGLSQALRWPHRLEDWRFVHRLGTGFVADDNGELVGTGLCWKYGENHASLGLIIVSSERQGKGIGRELMTRILEELGDRNTLLIATPAGQPLYERLGFAATGTIHQHQGTMPPTAPVALASGETIRLATAGDSARLAVLAARGAGMPRDDALAQLQSVGEVALIEKDGEAVGFSIMRPFGRGHVIGPLVAPDPERAKALIAYWAGAYAGCFVRVDVTGASGLSPWLIELGLTQVDQGVSMVRGTAPARDEGAQQFAVINQALC